jgi:ATP-dependent Clp protease ATP-binding subunit ClpA
MRLLLAIADAPEHEVRAELTRLQAAEFLYETRLFPDLEYTFKHALTHEVAYQGLLHERQRALHARITEAIERLSTEHVAIGSDLPMDYTAVGQTTHLAARMEQMAMAGATLLTPATLQLAEGYVDVKTRGPVPVKSLPDPVEVYELVGAGAVRSRLHAAATRGLTRFVGRDSELDQLRQALGRSQAGHGQVVAVVGETGVGKSRLYWEFTHSHRAHGWLIVEAGWADGGAAHPATRLEQTRAHRHRGFPSRSLPSIVNNVA